jgi:3-phosphoshikimate 1-carboxyvinyltransferase
MNQTVRPGTVQGSLRVPASKSHTIRALVIASLADGESTIENPLDSRDADACIAACRALGAEVSDSSDAVHDSRVGGEAPDQPSAPGGAGASRLAGRTLRIRGTAGQPGVPNDIIDVGNSGTTLYIVMGTAALVDGWSFFTGDDQIRRRSAGPLLASLGDLGAKAFSSRDNGCAPIAVRGPLAGGRTSIECPTSQYLSSLLLAAPLASGDTEIEVPLLNERPYVEMTLWWLESQGITVERRGWEHFAVPGGGHYSAFEASVPGDYSSATFPMVAAAITGGEVTLEGLEEDDPQGDKAVIDILREMGCRVERRGHDAVTVAGPPTGTLRGGTFDLNAIPDALPALAVAGCYADRETTLANVPQAREKETDRVAVMAEELGKLGARIEERPDGLVVHPRRAAVPRLTGGTVSGHGDHRIVMALAVAGLAAEGPIKIEGSEAAEVTYPGFFDDLRRLRGENGTAHGDL